MARVPAADGPTAPGPGLELRWAVRQWPTTTRWIFPLTKDASATGNDPASDRSAFSHPAQLALEIMDLVAIARSNLKLQIRRRCMHLLTQLGY